MEPLEQEKQWMDCSLELSEGRSVSSVLTKISQLQNHKARSQYGVISTTAVETSRIGYGVKLGHSTCLPLHTVCLGSTPLGEGGSAVRKRALSRNIEGESNLLFL